MCVDSARIPRLSARVSSLSGTPWESVPLLDLLPSDAPPFAWLGFRQSMVGWGSAARWSGSGPRAIDEAAAWWDRVSVAASVDAPEGAPSLSLAFGSFGFAVDTPGLLEVPGVLVLDTPEGRWAITAAEGGAPDPLLALAEAPRARARTPEGLRTEVGRMTQAEWSASVEEMIGRLRAGEASKAVMARDMLVRADTPIDPRHLLARLDALYPATWRFAVDGLIGATPEMLGSAAGGRLRSRVLAGTAPAGTGRELLASAKNLREHALAVESVTSALAPLVDSLEAPDSPFVLDLPNVSHLASDVDAVLGGLPLLGAISALHPTAAVCGTPREEARALLAELERTERGRYSGPVGWIDAAGEGEFGIALRCGLLEDGGRALRVFAGGGIMPDSDPAEELAETRRKMAPLLDALGVD